MAKDRGSGGRGKSKAADPWAGWTTSRWDVRAPGGGSGGGGGSTKAKSKTQQAKTAKRNAMGGARVAGTTGFSKRSGSASKTGKAEMRNLQNQLTTAAKAHGITSDKPIPGLGGLTPRNLSRRQFPASEGHMRAALAELRRTL